MLAVLLQLLLQQIKGGASRLQRQQGGAQLPHAAHHRGGNAHGRHQLTNTELAGQHQPTAQSKDADQRQQGRGRQGCALHARHHPDAAGRAHQRAIASSESLTGAGLEAKKIHHFAAAQALSGIGQQQRRTAHPLLLTPRQGGIERHLGEQQQWGQHHSHQGQAPVGLQQQQHPQQDLRHGPNEQGQLHHHHVFQGGNLLGQQRLFIARSPAALQRLLEQMVEQALTKVRAQATAQGRKQIH